MTIGESGIALIKSFESCQLTAYWDGTHWKDGTKRWSIGWGTTIHNNIRVQEGETCTQYQADSWLDTDLLGAETTVQSCLHVAVTQNQFDALVSLAYNAGPPCGSMIYRLINSGNSLHAADEFPKWNKAHINGILQESPGLTRRRLAERVLFVTV